MYLTSASGPPTGRRRAGNERSERRLFEIGAECAVIVDQASGEGQGRWVTERGSFTLHKQSWRTPGRTVSGKTARMHVRGTMKEASFFAPEVRGKARSLWPANARLMECG